MSDQEVLQAAIDKAIDGGWRGDLLSDFYLESQPDGLVRVYWDDTEWSILDVIFSHKFCEALFPGKHHCNREKHPTLDAGCDAEYEWQYHGTQMFLAEDRIDYLRKHLDV